MHRPELQYLADYLTEKNEGCVKDDHKSKSWFTETIKECLVSGISQSIIIFNSDSAVPNNNNICYTSGNSDIFMRIYIYI
jgi:hypothetical protein